MLFHLCTMAPGVLIVALTLWQIFADLFHPTAQGSLSDVIARSVWRTMRRRESMRGAAGPVSLVLVIFSWVMLLAAGFALIYWPEFPSAFRFTGAPESGFAVAIYFSLESLTTLGLGEIMPIPAWLRFTVTLEAMFGLALVTACVSWTVLLYPALARMRLLARQAILLADAVKKIKLPGINQDSGYLLENLARQVVRTRVDLIYFPILYYFHAAHKRSSLAHALPILVEFCETGLAMEGSERVRLAAEMLRCALEDLGDLLSQRFLCTDEAELDVVLKTLRRRPPPNRLTSGDGANCGAVSCVG